jgi:four helix bundle protein
VAVTRFEELQVWKLARALNRRVYTWTRIGAVSRDFAFSTQVRRASLSVMNNIAEGFERYRRKEFLQFLSLAKGSAGEVRSMLFAALDIGYLTPKQFESLSADTHELARTLSRFQTGLERSVVPKPSKPRATRPSGLRTED